jgi:hypothetical protein
LNLGITVVEDQEIVTLVEVSSNCISFCVSMTEPISDLETPGTSSAPPSAVAASSKAAQTSGLHSSPSTKTASTESSIPQPSYVKLAMRNMVRKRGTSLYHFALTVVGLVAVLVGLAYLTR